MDEVHHRNGSPTQARSANGRVRPDLVGTSRRKTSAGQQAGPDPSRQPSTARASKRVEKSRQGSAALAGFTPYATPGRDPSIPRGAPLCAHCVSLCCRYIALPLDLPESASDYDDIRWYLMHENIHVFVDDGDWFVAFATRCKNLAPDNRCRVYETRPRICRGYDTDDCEFHGTEYRYEHLFTSAEQLEAYAEKELGRKIFFRPRRKKLRQRRGRNGKRRVELPIA